MGAPPAYRIAVERQRAAEGLADGVLSGAQGGPAPAKLAAIGVLPGCGITLQQRYPAFVFRMGYHTSRSMPTWHRGSA